MGFARGYLHYSSRNEEVSHVSGSRSLHYVVSQQIILPCWLLLTVLGIIPVIAATRAIQAGQRRRSRFALDYCIKCGYDLRGSAERCPECGTSIVKT